MIEAEGHQQRSAKTINLVARIFNAMDTCYCVRKSLACDLITVSKPTYGQIDQLCLCRGPGLVEPVAKLKQRAVTTMVSVGVPESRHLSCAVDGIVALGCTPIDVGA